jgi:hypothetical protein
MGLVDAVVRWKGVGVVKKERLTKQEYLQLIGLLVLGKKHMDTLQDIIKAIGEVTGDGPDGHCADAVYSNYDADLLLEKLDIEFSGQGFRNEVKDPR